MNQDWRNFPMLCGEDIDKLPLLEMGAFISLADLTDPDILKIISSPTK